MRRARGDRITAGGRIARPVGEQDAVGRERERLFERGLRRHHRDAAAARSDHAQDVALDAVIVDHHVPRPFAGRHVAAPQLPFALVPGDDVAPAHFFGQIHAGQAGEGARQGERLGHVRRLAHRGRDDGACLRTAIAQDAGEAARVDAGDRHHPFVAQSLGQSAAHAEVARQKRHVAHHQPGGHHPVGFEVFVVDADVADVRIGERDDLPGITRVGENFLIARHRGVEHHLTDGVTGRTDALAVEHRSVGKDEDRGIERHDGSLQWIQRCVSCPPKKTGWARFAIPFFTFIFYRENLPAAIAAPFSASPARRACRRDRAGAPAGNAPHAWPPRHRACGSANGG